MIERVGLAVDDIHVDGCRASVIEVCRHALKVGEVVVGIAIEVLVVGYRPVVGEQREVYHVLACLVVVDSLWCPYSCNVGEIGACVFCREVYGMACPVDEVVRLHKHESAVARPSECRLHVRNGHVELSVLSAQDVRVAESSHYGIAFGCEEWLSVVERCVVVAVLRDGVV